MSRRSRRRWGGSGTYWPRACWFRLFPPAAWMAAEQAARQSPTKEDSPCSLSSSVCCRSRFRRHPVMLIAQLPDAHVTAAVMLLACLIARAAAPGAMTPQAGASADE